MNTMIKILEEIGQSASLNQHEDLLKMLEGLKVKPESLSALQNEFQEFVCAIFPEDDEDTEDEGEDESE